MKYAIISDIHEDIAGLQRALLKIAKNNVDHVICLGDISGFSVPHYHYFDIRNAHECLRLVRENCKYIIPGNHDLNACKRVPDVSPGFSYPENWFELDYFQKKELAKGKLWLYEENELPPYYTHDDIEFLFNLSLYQNIEHEKILLTHYIYPNLVGNYSYFCHQSHDFKDHFNFMKENNAVVGFVGHAHPEKPMIVTRNKVTSARFGQVLLPGKQCVIIVPAIAGSKRKNGFCIFDPNENKLITQHI